MAQQSEFVIWIKNGTQGRASPVAGGIGSDDNKPKYTNGQLRAQGALKAMVAYDKFAAPFVESAINYRVSSISLRTGSSELQERVEFGMSAAKSAIGLVSSVVSGYAVGNLPGAIIGGLISVGTTAMNYAQKVKTIRLQGLLENASLRGINARSGGYAPTSAGSRGAKQ